MDKSIMARLLLVAALCAPWACSNKAGTGLLGDGGSDLDTDADSDADADSDSDSDSDADADSDSDGDSDGDSDADGDSDGDSDADGDSDPECVDEDGDTWCLPFDCDDGDPDVYPGAEEIVGNGEDVDCDGLEDDAGGDADADAVGDADTDADADTDTECIDECDEELPDTPVGTETYTMCDHFDNDYDGDVDEACSCTVGAVQWCFIGPPNFHDQGACMDGTQSCVASAGSEFGHWGECINSIAPAPEVCDDVDNDCDGCTDDDLCCDPPIDCGGPLPDAVPFTDYVVDGTDFYGGTAISWSWTISVGPCDIVDNRTSFEVNGSFMTPSGGVVTVGGASMSSVTYKFYLSGQYTLTMTVQTPDGPYTCTWIIHVVGPGLRVEMCWDTTTSTDIDLHMGKQGTTSDWFSDVSGSEDCYYTNCSYTWGHTLDWGYPDSDISVCEGNEYADWSGSCPNPRIDIDNYTNMAGVPENLNLDNPEDGDVFRVLVHYYGDDGYGTVTHPVVNIYCDGVMLGSYGVSPQVSGYDTYGYDDGGDGWKVVDVVTNVSGGVTTCDLYPLLSGGNYIVESGPFNWATPAWP